jgi:hypothetical protein
MTRLLVAVALAVAFVALDPAGTFRPEALARFAQGGLVAAIGVAVAIAGGGAVLRRWQPDVLDGPAGWLAALGVGVVLQGAGMLAFAAFGRAGLVASATVALALACGALARPGVRLPRPGWPAVAIAGLFFAPALAEALAPPTDTDELYQHLAIARLVAETGHMPGGFAHPDGSRPLPVHLVFAQLFALGGETAPRLWHLAIVAALAQGVRELGTARFGARRGDGPALVLLGSWSFLREAGLAYHDHLVALWLLLAADAMGARRWAWMGWLCGFALAAKYTAAPVVAALLLVALADEGIAGARRLLPAGIAILVPLVPWWLRNTLDGLHPLFPYAGWPEASGFVFVYTEKYGLGRDLVSSVLLPWNLLMRAEHDSFVFLGRVNLAWAALAVGAIATARTDGLARRLAAVVAIGFVGWAAGPQILRYLLPLSGVAALAGAAARFGPAAMLLWVVSLPANLAPALTRAAERAAVATGNEAREDFLGRELPAWPALAYLRDHVPADARVALLFSWHGYYVRQDWVLGSVEDHVPSRWWVWSHGDASLADLRAQGVTHVFVGDTRFLSKAYGFLPKDVLATQFNEPVEELRALLLREASRVYAAHRWEVWRLDAPPPNLDAPAPTP